MQTFRRTLLATAFFATLVAAPALHAQTAVKVDGAWARPTVQGQAAGGGFLKITGGPAADKLVSASASVSKTVELHTMVMEGDVMRMREIGAIEVPAGKTVELKPGGLHVMFIGIHKPLKNGDSFPLTLRFEKAGEVKVEMKVMTQAGMPAMPMGAGEHKH
ncbi:MAG: copper chaperone PCu(A)C [Rubrivivax sp.]|nr:copper chaperone PCu(A)C [Rubrivivax sp.]